MSGADPDRDVVLVDDDPLVLRLVGRRLRGTGLTLATHAEAAPALEWLRHHRARLLLIDLRIGTDSGVELLAALRAEGRLAGVRCRVCTSAPPGPDVVATIERLGASLLAKERILEPGGIERLLGPSGDGSGAA